MPASNTALAIVSAFRNGLLPVAAAARAMPNSLEAHFASEAASTNGMGGGWTRVFETNVETSVATAGSGAGDAGDADDAGDAFAEAGAAEGAGSGVSKSESS